MLLKNSTERWIVLYFSDIQEACILLKNLVYIHLREILKSVLNEKLIHATADS